MPIYLTLNNSDPDGRPWKVANGKDKRGKVIHKTRYHGKATVYVEPCSDHERPVVGIPVQLRIWDKEKKSLVELGIASACPVCWTILKSPEKSP